MKLLFSIFIFTLLSLNSSFADESKTIGITVNKPFIEVSHNGKTVKIERGLVNNENIKTKHCPPFCIKPLVIAPNVETFAELEVVSFLSDEVKNEKGFLVDTRMTEFFEKETIPGSINIPFVLFSSKKIIEALKLLGVNEKDSKKDFSEAKTMCFFCDDSLCEESSKSISALLSLGYPANKLKYYKGGIKAWKALNLTIIASDTANTN